VPSYEPASGAASAVNRGGRRKKGRHNLNGASKPYNDGRKARAVACVREYQTIQARAPSGALPGTFRIKVIGTGRTLLPRVGASAFPTGRKLAEATFKNFKSSGTSAACRDALLEDR
jgi:hypothetical protein